MVHALPLQLGKVKKNCPVNDGLGSASWASYSTCNAILRVIRVFGSK